MLLKRSEMYSLHGEQPLKMIVARDPTFHWLLKSQLFDGKSANRSVQVGEWERLKECCQERAWKKQKQTCNQKEKNRHMTFETKMVSHSEPCWKLSNQSTMTSPVSFDRFWRQQARKHTPSQLDISAKSVTHFKGKCHERPCDALYALEVESNQWVAE